MATQAQRLDALEGQVGEILAILKAGYNPDPPPPPRTIWDGLSELMYEAWIDYAVEHGQVPDDRDNKVTVLMARIAATAVQDVVKTWLSEPEVKSYLATKIEV